ncbi:hypothetical protein ACOKM3_08120 [Streptomyces sp. BH106]|uniref:hypothetical protein n=1 Tax=Streptomyces sp. BH106 TaxID=3410409 RepID=UPI003CEE807A
MHQALALASVLLAALGAVCCAGGRPRVTAPMMAMALMVLAMLDTMTLGSVLLDPFVWAAVLACGALAAVVMRRYRSLRLEHAAHLAVMALLIGAAGLSGGRGSHVSHPVAMVGAAQTQVMSTGVPSGLLVLCEVLAACGWGGVLLGRSLVCSGTACAERLAGAGSLLLMAGMCVLG